MAPAVVGSHKDNSRDNANKTEQVVGQATSVVMPLIELGAVAFITWVLVYLICVQYLMNPSEDIQRDFDMSPRRATGIALLVVYALLLAILLIPWLRLTQMIWSKPDLIPLGDTTQEKLGVSTNGFGFDHYDAYVCDFEGTPLFCEKCHNWKPDRTHHCKELGRCVRKMDHYCPWAGGIIGESTHKFFMQTLIVASLYTTYTWIVLAVFLGDRNSRVSLPVSYMIIDILTAGRWAHAQEHGSLPSSSQFCSASLPLPWPV